MIKPKYMLRFPKPLGIGILLISYFFVFVPQAQELPPEVLSYADIILYNGQVLTMDRDQPPFTVAEALAIRDGKILAVGENDRILGMAGAKTTRCLLYTSPSPRD